MKKKEKKILSFWLPPLLASSSSLSFAFGKAREKGSLLLGVASLEQKAKKKSWAYLQRLFLKC